MKGRGLPKGSMYSSMTHRTFPKRSNVNQAIIRRDRTKMTQCRVASRPEQKIKPKTARARVSMPMKAPVIDGSSQDPMTGHTSITKEANNADESHARTYINVSGSYNVPKSKEIWTHRDSGEKGKSKEMASDLATPRITSAVMTPRSAMPDRAPGMHDSF